MDNLTNNDRHTADPAEAEQQLAASGLGKFKDVQTLIKAYSDLEAEFTRRSQRLKELESGNKAAAAPDGVTAAPSQNVGQDFINSAIANPEVRDAVIGDYLRSVISSQGVPLTAGGGAVSAPRVAPKTVREAGALAKQFLYGQKP